MTNWLVPVSYSEAEMIDIMEVQVGVIGDQMTKAYSREWLEAAMRQQLLLGVVEMQWAIDQAYTGDVIADAALRSVWADMESRHEEAPVPLQAYMIKVATRDHHVTRGRGHHWYDDWRRNIGIAVLVYRTCEQFGLHPTRNREQKRRKQPSGSSIVAAALGKHQVNIKEKTVENIWAQRQGDVAALLARESGGEKVPK